MDINTAKERIRIIGETVSREDAEAAARKKRSAAFGTISQMTHLFSGPKDDEFELTYTEHRYEPVWHIAAHAHYVYDRSRTYSVPVSDPTVTTVTILGTTYNVVHGHISIPTSEHCMQDERADVTLDGLTGVPIPRPERYTGASMKDAGKTVEASVSKGSIIVPPSVRTSGIVRETVSGLIKGIQADAVSEEEVAVDAIDLLYRPVYAFSFTWKGKTATIAVDAVTGAVSTGQRTFTEYLGKALDTNFLFDVGADAAGMFIPGGSIAVKVAKKVIEAKKGK